MDRPRSATFTACGHWVVCVDCAAELVQRPDPRCPHCRGAIVLDEAGDLWVEGDRSQTFQPAARRPAAAPAAPAAAGARQHQRGHDRVVEAVRRLRNNDATLTTLQLHCIYTDIGDAEAQALAVALHENATLTTLMLRGNDIGVAGAQSLAGALRENAMLTTLELHGNSMGDAGAQALAGALRENVTLTTLELGENSIGEAGAQALAGGALQENATLTTLELYGIGEAWEQALADVLDGRPGFGNSAYYDAD